MKNFIFYILLLLNSNCLAQLDGQIDSTFGLNGVASSTLNFGGYAKKIKLNNSGKVLAAGTIYGSSTPDNNFGALQFNADGTVDPNFGYNGSFEYNFGDDDYCTSICVLNNDKIVLGGYSSTIISYTPINIITKCSFIRLNSNGLIDSSFNNSGTLQVSIPNSNCVIQSMALQDDGKIVAIGSCGIYGTIQFLVIRINIDGTLDSTFGLNGIINFQIDSLLKNDEATCVTLQDDNKILIAGNSYMPSTGGGRSIALCRLNSDGSFDSSFSTNGIMQFNIPNNANDVTNSICTQSDGRIVLVGNTFNNKLASICRFEATGEIDSTFGQSGYQLLNLSNGNDVAFDVINQIDSKLVIVGYSSSSTFILRLKQTGEIDSTFNNIGINYFGDASSNEGFYCVTKDSQNRILAGGYIVDSLQKQQFSIVAYNSIFFNGLHNSESEISALEVYPNPASGIISLKNLDVNSLISIYDLTGTLISESAFKLSHEIDICDLSSGIYFIRAISGDGEKFSKFIKQ